MPETRPMLLMTGASRGIGKAIFEMLKENYEIITIGRDKTSSICWDLSRPLDISIEKKIKDITLSKSLKGILHCAGVLGPWGGPESASQQPNYWTEAEIAYHVNVSSFLQLFSVALPFFAKEGSFVFQLSSGAAVNPYVGWDTYCTTKAALLMAFRTLAKRYAPAEMLCLSVAPGTVMTDMMKDVLAADEKKFPAVGKFKDLQKNGNLVEPGIAANAVNNFLHSSFEHRCKFHGELYDVRKHNS